jgi:hypothetical protein
MRRWFWKQGSPCQLAHGSTWQRSLPGEDKPFRL